MRSLLRAVATLLASTATLVTAHSQARNPIRTLAVVQNASIHTANHRATALSHFDLSFALYGTHHIKLSLEPNHDIISDGATVEYLGPDGNVARTETINRLDHKVYKGVAWLEDNIAGQSRQVGWARIVVRRDGADPLFEGAFTIERDHHHIQLSENYAKTKHDLDPTLEGSGDGFMVVWRDSDIAADAVGVHEELKRESTRDLDSQLSCRSDSLEFNMQPDHPVYVKMLKREDSYWGAMPAPSFFNNPWKRQIDTSLGGNSAGVNLVSSIGQTSGCPTTRKVALVGVATDCTYTASFNSSETARQNVITQMNTASSLYESTFNKSLGLQNLTIMMDANCPGSQQAATPWNEACSGNVNIQDRLNLFSAWRGTKQDGNSHWTLLTTCNTGSAVGLAWLGQACVYSAQTSNSSGGGQETVSGANVVVRTGTEWQVIAHETGHTFGAVHDCTSQTCSDGTSVNAQQCCPLSSSTCNAGERYIMNPSTAQGITNFSPCSIGNICSAMGRNSVRTGCLSNNKGVTTISGQQCGNGIVEAGEDCDCGGAASCGNNPCCDAATCKFKNNAVCDDSNEDCCRNCQLASASTICRPSTGQCDPQETCSGTSPTCPADVTAPDGQGCGNGLQCASGHCTSRDLQCKTVMGSYTTGNDTYACDSSSCAISCASPSFGIGVCYGLQQNFLDGTTCGGGGHCSNGQCKGASLGGQVGSWITDHKPLVIGLAAAIGGLILLSLLGCLVRCCKRRRNKPPKTTVSPPLMGWNSLPPQGWRPQRQGQGQGGTRGQPMYQHGGGGGGGFGGNSQWYGAGGPQPPPAYAPPGVPPRGASVRYA